MVADSTAGQGDSEATTADHMEPQGNMATVDLSSGSRAQGPTCVPFCKEVLGRTKTPEPVRCTGIAGGIHHWLFDASGASLSLICQRYTNHVYLKPGQEGTSLVSARSWKSWETSDIMSRNLELTKISMWKGGLYFNKTLFKTYTVLEEYDVECFSFS